MRNFSDFLLHAMLLGCVVSVGLLGSCGGDDEDDHDHDHEEIHAKIFSFANNL